MKRSFSLVAALIFSTIAFRASADTYLGNNWWLLDYVRTSSSGTTVPSGQPTAALSYTSALRPEVSALCNVNGGAAIATATYQRMLMYLGPFPGPSCSFAQYSAIEGSADGTISNASSSVQYDGGTISDSASLIQVYPPATSGHTDAYFEVTILPAENIAAGGVVTLSASVTNSITFARAWAEITSLDAPAQNGGA